MVRSRRGPSATVVELGLVARRATFRSTATASGEIVPARYADIGASVMGKIVALPVKEGDRVRAGQVLARIDPVQAESAVAGASAQVRALESDERGAAEQRRAADSDHAAAGARLRDAEQKAARAKALFAEGLVAASEFDAARAAVDVATAQVAAASAARDRAQQTADAAGARLSQARAQLRGTADLLAKAAVVAPMDGIVSRLRVREGEMVVVGIQNQPGTTLMTIADLGQIDAEVKLAEADVLRVSLGQRAMVTLEALPGRPFEGKVVEIGASALPGAGTASAAREFKVVVRLDRPDPALRPGLTCDAEIVTSERSGVLTVPLQSVVLRAEAGAAPRSGLFTVKEDRAVFTPVTTGVIGGLEIEVAGVAEGTPVIVGPFLALRALQPGASVKAPASKAP